MKIKRQFSDNDKLKLKDIINSIIKERVENSLNQYFNKITIDDIKYNEEDILC